MERAATQELSQEGGWWQIIIRYSLEILQELQQAVSLSKFLTILRHLLEQRFCLHLENRQLIEHRRIQHGIGILLEWENPLVLSGSYRWPAADGFLGRYTSIFIVADDAAQQTVVRCRDVIVIIQQNGGQRRSIHTEDLLFGNMRRKLRIQGVDSLYHQNIVRLQLQLLSTLHTLARREIVFRQFHLLATEERIKLLVEQIEVQGIDALKIKITISSFGVLSLSTK